MTTPSPYSARTGQPAIAGVVTRPLRVIADERGWLMEVLRRDDPMFKSFGQAYISATYPGVVKAWHYHEKQVDLFACVAGMVKLVLHDTREGSPTHGVTNEFVIGDRNPMLVLVPNHVYHGWKCLGTVPALVLNVPTEPYDHESPDEFRLEPHGSLPYDWSRHDG